MRLRLGVLALNLAALGFADTLTLRNGQVLNGDYVGGDARHIKFATGDRVDTYSVDDVESLRFRLGDRLGSDAAAPRRDYDRQPDPGPPPRTGFAQQPAPPPPDAAYGIQ